MVFATLLMLCSQITLSADEAGEVLFSQKLPATPALILIEVLAGERKCMMLLDTGAEYTFFDNSLKDLLGNSVSDITARDAANAPTPAKVYNSPPLKAQNLTASDPQVALLDLRRFHRLLGGNFDGVLGVREMGAGKLSINYDTDFLQIHSGDWKLSGADCHEVDLVKDMKVLVFQGSMEGRACKMTIDTGSNGTISLESSLFDTLVSDGVIECSVHDSGAQVASGYITTKWGWFTKGEFMGKSLKGMSVSSAKGFSGTSTLGLEWLWGFNFEIDFTARRFRYQIRPAAKPPLAVELMVGAGLSFSNKGAGVEGLRPGGGPCEDAGLALGDVIESFDALKGSQITSTTVAEVVTAKAGAPIPIRFRRISDGALVDASLKLPPPISAWDFAGKDILQKAEAERSKSGQPDGLGESRGLPSWRQAIPPFAPLITAQVKINGDLRLMSVNTGAQIAKLDFSLRRSLQPRADGKGPSLILVSHDLPEGSPSPTFNNLGATFSDFQKFSMIFGHPLAGALSARSFSTGKFLIDCSSGIAEDHIGGWALDSRGVREIHWENGDLPLIGGKISGHEFSLLIDTGGPSCIGLEPSLFDTLVSEHVIQLANEKERAFLFRPRGDSSKEGWFLKGELMGKSLRGVTVYSTQQNVAGLQWLRGFDTEIDFAAKKVRFAPCPDPEPPVDVWMMFGAIFTFDEFGGKVEELRADGNGPAQAAGLAAGDLIESIDGFRGEALDFQALSEIAAAKAGSSIEVEFIRPATSSKMKTQLQLPARISPWNFGGREGAIGRRP